MPSQGIFFFFFFAFFIFGKRTTLYKHSEEAVTKKKCYYSKASLNISAQISSSTMSFIALYIRFKRNETLRWSVNHKMKSNMYCRCAAPIALNAVNSQELLTKMIRHSVSRAWRLGKAVLNARKDKTSILSAIIGHENAQLLCTGKVIFPVLNVNVDTCCRNCDREAKVTVIDVLLFIYICFHRFIVKSRETMKDYGEET